MGATDQPLNDHARGYRTYECGCCVFVYRTALVALLRRVHGDALICRVACEGMPGAVDRTQLMQALDTDTESTGGRP